MYVDQDTKTITCKVAYYGPGMAGKTSTLQYLHDHAPVQAGPVISTDVDSERLLHFQFIRNDLPEFKGYRLVFDFHTIPGQSYYLNTRLKLLEGADGIVFVVDSTREAMDENIDSMNDLYENLRKQNIANDIPLCVQFNKQDDSSAIPLDQLQPLLNSYMKQSFASSATTGAGIIETMQYITDEVVQYIETQGFGSSSSYPVPEPSSTAGSSLTPIQPNQLSSSPITSAITKNEYWLLSCYSCDSILEVPKAKTGDMFMCGNCQQAIEVVNPETGLTKAPSPQAIPAARPQAPAPLPPSSEDSEYSMQPLPNNPAATQAPPPPSPSETSEFNMSALPDPGANALAQNDEPSGGQPVNLPQILPNYTTIRSYENSLLGHRYLLQDQTTGVKVRALVVSQEASRQPGFQSFLDNQIRQASQVHHQNITAYVGMHMAGSQPIILSQHTDDCESLAEIIARRKKLKPPQAIDIVHKLAMGLTELKRRNLSHGWVRPECIQIGPSGTVLLDDIALPKLHTYLVREGRGRTASTEYYLAPEHHTGESQSDERSDMFQLGILLFKMLSGEGLVTGFSAHEALHKLKSSGVRSLRSACPDLSRDIDNIFGKMCAIERKDRFQSINMLADVLARFGGGAKRVTLRQTRTHTRSISNGGAGRNQHTATVRRTTMRHARSSSDYEEYEAAAPPRRRKSGNTFTYILLILLAGAIAYAVYWFNEQQKRMLERQELDNTPSNQQTHKPKTTNQPDENKEPTVRKSLEGRIADMLDQFRDEPNNTDLEKQIISDLSAVKAGKRKVQLIDKLKEIREYHVNLASKKPDQKPKTTEPKVNPDKEPSEQNVAAIIQDIDFHLARNQYHSARTKAEAIKNADVKATQLALVNKKHSAAKAGIQLQANATDDLAKIDALLRPVRNDWGSEEDRKWADNLYKAAKDRVDAKVAAAAAQEKQRQDALNQAQKNADETAEKKKPSSLDEPITLNGYNYLSILTDIKIDKALENGELATAQRLAKDIPATTKEALAINLKLQLESQAIETMSSGFKDNNIRFRIKAPYKSDERWDVTDITSSGLQLRSPQGTSTKAQWKQIDAGEKEKLYAAIANHEHGSATQQAIACVSYLRLGQIGPATIAKNSARKRKYEQIALLDNLIAMRRTHEVARAAQAALTAHQAGETEAFHAAYKELKAMGNLDVDSEAFIKVVASFISIPEENEAHPNSLKNLLDFKDENDLLAFTEKSGEWALAEEKISNGQAVASLKRTDMKGTTKVNLKATFPEAKGSMSINFRGGFLNLRVGEQRFHLVHGEKATTFMDYPFIANLQYNIALWLDHNKNLNIEINQAATQSIKIDDLTEEMEISINGLAKVSIDDISYEREQLFVLPEIDQAKQDMIKTALGWTPYGGAELHAPVIKLPPWPGARSGIARTITAQDKGVECEVKGSGDFFIMIGDRETNNLDGMKLPLPLATDIALKISITWTQTSLRIESSLPQQATPNVDIINNLKVPIKHICLESSKTVNIIKPPVMKR